MVFPQNATGKLGYPFARAMIELDAKKARTTAKLSHHALKCLMPGTVLLECRTCLIEVSHRLDFHVRASFNLLSTSGSFCCRLLGTDDKHRNFVVVPGEDDAIPIESSTRGTRVAAHNIDSFQYALARIIIEVVLLFNTSVALV